MESQVLDVDGEQVEFFLRYVGQMLATDGSIPDASDARLLRARSRRRPGGITVGTATPFERIELYDSRHLRDLYRQAMRSV